MLLANGEQVANKCSVVDDVESKMWQSRRSLSGAVSAANPADCRPDCNLHQCAPIPQSSKSVFWLGAAGELPSEAPNENCRKVKHKIFKIFKIHIFQNLLSG